VLKPYKEEEERGGGGGARNKREERGQDDGISMEHSVSLVALSHPQEQYDLSNDTSHCPMLVKLKCRY